MFLKNIVFNQNYECVQIWKSCSFKYVLCWKQFQSGSKNDAFPNCARRPTLARRQPKRGPGFGTVTDYIFPMPHWATQFQNTARVPCPIGNIPFCERRSEGKASRILLEIVIERMLGVLCISYAGSCKLSRAADRYYVSSTRVFSWEKDMDRVVPSGVPQ